MKNKEIEELKKRVEALEGRFVTIYPPIYIQPTVPATNHPNLHYHNHHPCYNNPCYWAGSN